MSAYLSLIGRRRGGRLFEAGRLLTFSAFKMGAYSRWALIRGWALIRINTVSINIDVTGLHILTLAFVVAGIEEGASENLLPSMWGDQIKPTLHALRGDNVSAPLSQQKSSRR